MHPQAPILIKPKAILLKVSSLSIAALHYVSDDDGLGDLKPWVITHHSFTKLLDYLQQNGYNTICFEDIQKGNIPAKSVVLTFDDCPKQLWDFAIPEMIKRGMRAVFYMPTEQLGGYNKWDADNGHSRIDLMDEDDLKRLVAAGMEIGTHAHNHIMLEECTVEEAVNQLVKSKLVLESIIGKVVISIAYPYGSVPPQHKNIAADAGYEYGISVFTSIQSRYAIRRWLYTDNDTEKSIWWKLSATYRLYRSFRDNYDIIRKRTLQSLYRTYSGAKAAFRNLVIFIYTSVSAFEIEMTELCLYAEVL